MIDRSHSTVTASISLLTVCCSHKMAVLKVPFKAHNCGFVLSSSLYNTQFLSTQHSVPLYTTLSSSLYNTQFLSMQHSVPLYTTLSSCLYNTQFLSIQHSVRPYTTLSSSLHNTQFLSIQHSTLVVIPSITRRFSS